jgi:RNA polymerase primary sigma factor
MASSPSSSRHSRKSAASAFQDGTRSGVLADSTKLYLDEIGRYPLLKPAEEVSLAKQAQAGGAEGEAAVDWMVKCNLRLVVRVCKDFTRNTFDLMDLVSVGNEGLIVACRKYDASLGVPLANYAAIWIKQRVLRWVSEHGLPIKIPSYRAGIVNQVLRERNRLRLALQRMPSAEEIAEEMQRQRPGEETPGVAEIDEVLSLSQAAVELDAPVSEESGATTMGAFFGETLEESEDALSARLSRIDMERFAAHALSLLTEREARVIELAFGLGTGRPVDLEQIGQEFGVTRERIRQIRTSAIKKLAGEASLLQYVG